MGKGCVGQDTSPGMSLSGAGRSSTRNRGLPVTRLNVNTKPCFVAIATASIFFPFCVTVSSCGAAVPS